MFFGSVNSYLELILYILFLLALVIAAIAQLKVSLTFRRYSRVRVSAGKTAAEVAREILDENGITDVRIERIGGNLTDHFDPRDGALRLSDGVYDSDSAAAIGVAAHEAGHAIQHAKGYLPIIIRSKLVPITNIASRLSWIFVLIGVLIMGLVEFAYEFSNFGYIVALIGVGLFSVTTLFQLVTLPCEFDASHRAMQTLRSSGEFSSQELRASRKVLSAAAMTYVAALLVSIIQLLRIFAMVKRDRR